MHSLRIAAPLAAALLFASCGDSATSAAASTGTLYFSAIPDQNKTELEAKYAVVATFLSNQLGVDVQYVPTTDYGASVEAFVNGDVHLAWFGGVTGVQARERVAGAEAIAQGKVDPEYVSYFIANADSGITPGDDFPMGLEGKTFTFGSRSSTSGRVMPEFFIRENTGKAPEDFFAAAPQYSGAHDKTAKMVEAGTVDAGALSYKTYDRLVKEGKVDPARCVKVWTTPPYPDYNWTIHPEVEKAFGAGFTEKVQAALVGCTDAAVLKALDREEGLIPAASADFDPIATTMKAVGL